MKKFLLAVTILALVAVLGAGCTGALPSTSAPPATSTGEEVNFRLWISDEVNAIGDFGRLDVIISSVRVHQSGDPGTWHTLDPNPNPDGDEPGINLVPLTGPNALVIWEGTLPAGDYTKVFLDVNEEDITGILLDDDTADVKLPSDKLQISKPFTISSEDGQVVNFVYDITVVKAGESGKYILKPQIGQSGSDQDIVDVGSKGKPEGAGKPDEQSQGFEGIITTITEGAENSSPWTMTLEGVEGDVIVYVTELEGTPSVDAKAEVKGVLADNTIEDAKAEIKDEE